MVLEFGGVLIIKNVLLALWITFQNSITTYWERGDKHEA